MDVLQTPLLSAKFKFELFKKGDQSMVSFTKEFKLYPNYILACHEKQYFKSQLDDVVVE
jgi:hypothetical protein